MGDNVHSTDKKDFEREMEQVRKGGGNKVETGRSVKGGNVKKQMEKELKEFRR